MAEEPVPELIEKPIEKFAKFVKHVPLVIINIEVSLYTQDKLEQK